MRVPPGAAPPSWPTVLALCALGCDGDLRDELRRRSPGYQTRPVVSEPGPALSQIWPPATEKPLSGPWPIPRPGRGGAMFEAGGRLYEAAPGTPLRESEASPVHGRFVGEDADGTLWASGRLDDDGAGTWARWDGEAWLPVREERVQEEVRALEGRGEPIDSRWDRIAARAEARQHGELSGFGFVVGETLWAWSKWGIFYEDQGRVYRVRMSGLPVEVHGWGETGLVVLDSGEVLARSPWGNLLRGDTRSAELAGPAPEGGLPVGLAQEVEELPKPWPPGNAWPSYRVRLAHPPEGAHEAVVRWSGATVEVLRGGPEGELTCGDWRANEGIPGSGSQGFLHEVAVGRNGEVWATSLFGVHVLDIWRCEARWTPWPELDLEPE